MTIVVNQPMEGIERFDKKQDELVNPSFTILDNRFKILEFISISVLLITHQIGIGQNVILISNIPHASMVFTTPITTFEDTLDRHKTITPTDLQILSQVELVEATSVESIEKVINQFIIEG
jgi:hypothetical protein